jgi:peptide/nickel transport system substrate-binding protein
MKKSRSLNYLASVCLLLLLIVSTLLVTACPSPSTSTSASTPVITTTTVKPTATTPAVPVSVLGCPQGGPTPGLVPQYGGTLKFIYNHNVTNIGAPWKNSSFFDAHMNRYAIENLVGLDTIGQPIPQLATSWVSDPVNKTITFTLRQGVKFHDGTPFDAAAVKWCLDMYRTSAKPDLKAVTAVDVIDDNHLRLTLSAWDAGFVQSLSSTGAGDITSPTAAQKLGDNILLNPVGTGPFKFVSFQSNVSLKYERFNDYWQKGLPYLDAVEISFVADPVVALTSFIRGEAHALYGVATSNAKDLKAKGYTIDVQSAAIQGICGDSKNPSSPFSDIRVRQAIVYAIDTKTIVDSLFNGLYPATNQLALPGGTAYDASIKGYPYSEQKAKDLLKLAGYDTSHPLTMKLVYGSDPERTDLLTAVQNNLAKVGINVVLGPLDAPAFNKLVSSGWENQLLQYNFSYNQVEIQWGTSAKQSLAGTKNLSVSLDTPAAFDTLFATAMAENDLAKREAYYKQLNKMAIDDYCMVIPLMALTRFTAKSPKLIDFGQFNITSYEFLPERAWISK